MIWIIMSWVSLFVFSILSIGFVKRLRRLKSKYAAHENKPGYLKNTFIAEKNLAGNVNQIYENATDSNHVIDKYMISYEDGKPFLICHLLNPIENISIIEICAYGVKKELLYTLFIKNPEAFQQTPFIQLPKEAVDVNIRLHEDNDAIDGLSDHLSLKTKAYRDIAKYESTILFFLLAPLSYFLLNQIAEEQTSRYMNFATLSLGFIMMLITCILNYIFFTLWINRESSKRGGMREQERS